MIYPRIPGSIFEKDLSTCLSLPFPPLVSGPEMRGLETRTFAAGIGEETLMLEAGAGLAKVVLEWLPVPGIAVVFAGKGHNAGDAFVLAHHLLQAGWQVEIRLAWPETELRPLAAKQLGIVRDRVAFRALDKEEVPRGRPLLLVDGLLGIGGGGLLQGPAADGVRQINALRQREHALTLAVDLPSGLGCDPRPVTADLTVTLGWPKDLLFSDEATAAVGRLLSVPLTHLPPPEPMSQNPGGRDVLVTASGLQEWLLPRPAFARHKGQSGRIGILAGSQGLTGAARLASTAAVMLGGGLVTLFCPRNVCDILAAACPPEVMVRAVGSCQEVRDFPWDALGAGPGLGTTPLPMLADLILNDPRPLVLDADALNALAAGPWLGSAHRAGSGDPSGPGISPFAGPRLLTPHPGELARLVQAMDPGLPALPRRAQAQALARSTGLTVLAKSSRSFVIEKDRPAAWNGTGHPLMARGGMGDVLTGFLTVLTAQEMPLYHAAALGSWLLGRGGELYHQTTGWEEPGLASEVMRYAAGGAMAELRSGHSSKEAAPH
jgi:hydroxyethylthiazole kinase-like uncharacterized protein yjeF